MCFLFDKLDLLLTYKKEKSTIKLDIISKVIILHNKENDRERLLYTFLILF